MKNIALVLLTFTLLFACKKDAGIDPCDKNQQSNNPGVTTISILEKDDETLVISYSIDQLGHADGDGISESGIYYSNINQIPDETDLSIVNQQPNDKGVIQFDLEKDKLEIGRWYFRAYAVNCAGKSFGEVLSFTLEINPCDASINENLAEIVTQSVEMIGTNIEIEYAITRVGGDETGISAWGVCWTKEDRPPTIDDESINEGSIKVISSSKAQQAITNFDKGTLYKFRSYATNCAGTTYGNLLEFTTERDLCDGTDTKNFAILETNEMSKKGDKLEVVYAINQVGGDANGISSSGICWSQTNQNPTTNDDKLDGGATTSIGSLSVQIGISNFTEDIKFYLRAFATNCAGTFYSNTVEYTYIDYIAQIEKNMIPVAGGSFTMGCTDEQNNSEGCGEGDCYADECPIHPVMVNSFQISKFELTQLQWNAVMGSDPENLHNVGCGQCPVESISWDEVQEFIIELNKLSNKNYRLPTESEWEYAARGGNQSNGFIYAGSDDVNEVAWTGLNSRRKTHPVGEKKANELEIFDMSGNVYEYCSDDWHADYNGAPADGSAWIESPRTSNRMNRGGSWINYAKNCRVSNRYNDRSNLFHNSIGFRLAHD